MGACQRTQARHCRWQSPPRCRSETHLAHHLFSFFFIGTRSAPPSQRRRERRRARCRTCAQKQSRHLGRQTRPCYRARLHIVSPRHNSKQTRRGHGQIAEPECAKDCDARARTVGYRMVWTALVLGRAGAFCCDGSLILSDPGYRLDYMNSLISSKNTASLSMASECKQPIVSATALSLSLLVGVTLLPLAHAHKEKQRVIVGRGDGYLHPPTTTNTINASAHKLLFKPPPSLPVLILSLLAGLTMFLVFCLGFFFPLACESCSVDESSGLVWLRMRGLPAFSRADAANCAFLARMSLYVGYQTKHQTLHQPPSLLL